MAEGQRFARDPEKYLEEKDQMMVDIILDYFDTTTSTITTTMKETIVSVITDALQGLSDKIDAIKDVVTEAVAKEAELSVERDEQKARADAAEAKSADLQGQMDAANSELSNAADEIKALGEKIDGLTTPAAPVADQPASDVPAGQAPVADAPVADAPVESAPVVDAPVDVPVESAPVDQPAADAPVTGDQITPVESAPVADAPAADQPVQDVPTV